MDERVEELRLLRLKLKSGDYDGVDLMRAWIALEEYADMLERMKRPPDSASGKEGT
jgi:hypothetical protein